MSKRKKQIIYALIILSLGVNFMLLVNVFAVRMSNTNLEKYHNYVIQKEILLKSPEPAKSNHEETAYYDKNLLETTHRMAEMYEEKGDRENNPSLKNAFYSVALLEYAKLPKGVPQYAKLIREGRERLRQKMKKDTTLAVNLGDTREDLQKLYGLSQIQRANEKYLPTGIVNNEYYIHQGINFGLSNNRIYEIKLCSNFQGTWNGIKIGDNFTKISTLYPGRKIELAGSYFGYVVDNLKTTFIFVDKDQLLDGMRIEDSQYFGNWELALK